MSDLVVVATYSLPTEAQLAVNLLQSAGIEAFLDGDNVGAAFPGMSSWGDQLSVQVHPDDAQRATSLLAEAQARASLPEDWEDHAETVAVCSLCDSPIPEGAAECPACQTPRDAIRRQPIDPEWGVRKPGGAGPAVGEGIQAGDQVTAASPRQAPAAEEGDAAPGQAGGELGLLVRWAAVAIVLCGGLVLLALWLG